MYELVDEPKLEITSYSLSATPPILPSLLILILLGLGRRYKLVDGAGEVSCRV
jgi:hypothetical protein